MCSNEPTGSSLLDLLCTILLLPWLLPPVSWFVNCEPWIAIMILKETKAESKGEWHCQYTIVDVRRISENKWFSEISCSPKEEGRCKFKNGNGKWLWLRVLENFRRSLGAVIQTSFRVDDAAGSALFSRLDWGSSVPSWLQTHTQTDWFLWIDHTNFQVERFGWFEVIVTKVEFGCGLNDSIEVSRFVEYSYDLVLLVYMVHSIFLLWLLRLVM